jgi:hypothetical protein
MKVTGLADGIVVTRDVSLAIKNCQAKQAPASSVRRLSHDPVSRSRQR